jgi:hypothetical protein
MLELSPGDKEFFKIMERIVENKAISEFVHAGNKP